MLSHISGFAVLLFAHCLFCTLPDWPKQQDELDGVSETWRTNANVSLMTFTLPRIVWQRLDKVESLITNVGEILGTGTEVQLKLEVETREDVDSAYGVFEKMKCRAKDVVFVGPIKSLVMTNILIEDIKPLGGLVNLEWLDLAGTRVKDIAPLRSLAKLEYLILSATQVKDIKPLSRLVKLISLDVSETRITNIKPLSGLMNLKLLSMRKTRVKYLEPLRSLVGLVSIDLSETRVKDITSLRSLVNLDTLQLQNTEIEDVTALSSLVKLEYLNLQNTLLRDIKPLKGLNSLQSLEIKNTTLALNSQLLAEQVAELQVSVPDIRVTY
jgi:hypothetical protein